MSTAEPRPAPRAAGRRRDADLPLDWKTPPSWAEAALVDPIALLNDHAHLERKAAANARLLMRRDPRGPGPSAIGAGIARGWTHRLAQLAREETEHVTLVLARLAVRGGKHTREHSNPYAAALHAHVARGTGPAELADRLLVAALIEARSCERFALLASHARDADLSRLYRVLARAERGHHETFLDLARSLPLPEPLEARWQHWRAWESHIIQVQPPGSRLHSGCPGPSVS